MSLVTIERSPSSRLHLEMSSELFLSGAAARQKNVAAPEPVEYKYDGPWSISDVYVEDNVHYVDVKGGIYTLNGYVRDYWQTTKLNINDAYYNGVQFYIFLHVKYGPMQTHPLDDQVLIQTSVELHRYDWTPIYGYHENESYFPLAGILRTYGEWKNECFRVVMPQMMLFGAIPV